MNDIPLKEINHEFITKFEHYVKTEKSCAQNAAVKYLKNLKKIIKAALVNKWITDDPFLEIHFKQTRTNRAFLTEEELGILLKKRVHHSPVTDSKGHICLLRTDRAGLYRCTAPEA